MANAQNKERSKNLFGSKQVQKNIQQINNILGQANLSLYGTDRTSDVDALNGKFEDILNGELGSISKNDGDVTSFLSKLWSSDKKTEAMDELIDNQFMALSGDEYSSMQSFIYEAYRNRLLEQSDLHEISSQLIELSEAILITRDAIISADVVEGRMSRTIDFNNIDKEKKTNTLPIIESIEERFDLLEKIKNFIVPKTLEFGEYYMYIVPYSVIFNDFMRNKYNTQGSNKFYRESTLFESVSKSDSKQKKGTDKSDNSTFIKQLYRDYVATESGMQKGQKSSKTGSEPISESDFTKDITSMLKNISICNDEVPIPILEEGGSSINQFMTEFVNESGDTFTERKEDSSRAGQNIFNKIMNDDAPDGISFTTDNKSGSSKNDFSDIKDCYVKMIDPTKIIPIKIMDQTIGYYYVQSEDITPLSGMISSTLYYAKFNEGMREQTIIDSIAERIVDAFDKDFLKNNLKFKKTIVEAINYYNLNEKRLKFQFIPVEYIQEFKIDKDEEGNGQSMIKKSLFYAKLYLMILLFKIMSIILNSNDQKVNYIKQSGIDKNVANKVQEIARIKQSRQINMTDLFNYTTLINKVGSGMEMYIPTGRSGERPIETEILSGQDVPLNTELLEMLKNSYILATGVPAAIVNYMNEADFAKVIEQNNTKFNGRVVNYQLDFNRSITSMYKKIARWSTNIPENIIENLEFSLQPPKTVATGVKAEMIDNFNRVCDFLVSIMFEDPSSSTDETLPNKIHEFKKLFAQKQLPMLNMDKIEEIVRITELNIKKESLRPDGQNGDNGNDGFDEEIDNI